MAEAIPPATPIETIRIGDEFSLSYVAMARPIPMPIKACTTVPISASGVNVVKTPIWLIIVPIINVANKPIAIRLLVLIIKL